MKPLTTRGMYLDYPFKQYPTNKKTIPNPYFTKEQDTDCPESLKIEDWVLIVRTYFDIITDYLLQGGRFEMPDRLGHFEMKRVKRRVKEAWIHQNAVDAGYDRKLYGEVNNWRPILKWLPKARNSMGAITLKTWKMNLGKVLKRNIHNCLIKNPNQLMNYSPINNPYNHISDDSIHTN
jgi:hypothetical protein